MFRQLMFQKEKPFLLLMGIEGRIRDMLALRELMDAGLSAGLSQSTGFASVVWARIAPDAQRGGAGPGGSPAQGPSLPPDSCWPEGGASSFRARRNCGAGTGVAVQAHARLTDSVRCPTNCCWSAMLVELIQGGSRVRLFPSLAALLVLAAVLTATAGWGRRVDAGHRRSARAGESLTTVTNFWFPVGEELVYHAHWGLFYVAETRTTVNWTHHQGRDAAGRPHPHQEQRRDFHGLSRGRHWWRP
jgi:hypothetical protein